MESQQLAEDQEQEDITELCLELIQELHSSKIINDTQRDNLKDMIFDDDAILISFFYKYDDCHGEDRNDLKQDIVKYCGGGNFGGSEVPIEE